jgi:hypothetical protein
VDSTYFGGDILLAGGDNTSPLSYDTSTTVFGLILCSISVRRRWWRLGDILDMMDISLSKKRRAQRDSAKKPSENRFS